MSGPDIRIHLSQTVIEALEQVAVGDAPIVVGCESERRG
jgi:hypothetical protein